MKTAKTQRILGKRSKKILDAVDNCLKEELGEGVDFGIVVFGPKGSKRPEWISSLSNRPTEHYLCAMWCSLRDTGLIDSAGDVLTQRKLK